jgi:hypothetical protein
MDAEGSTSERRRLRRPWTIVAAALVAVAVVAGLLLWERPSVDAPDEGEAVAEAFLDGVMSGDAGAATAYADAGRREEWAGQMQGPIVWIRDNDAALDHRETRTGATFVAVLEAGGPTAGLSTGELSATVEESDGRWRVVAWSWRLRPPPPTSPVPPPEYDEDDRD